MHFEVHNQRQKSVHERSFLEIYTIISEDLLNSFSIPISCSATFPLDDIAVFC